MNQCPGSGLAFIIKTHRTSPYLQGGVNCPKSNSTGAIIIIRNPYAAMIANYNRLHSDKVGITSKTSFETDGKNYGNECVLLGTG